MQSNQIRLIAAITTGILLGGSVGFAAAWFGRPSPNITTWTDPENGCQYLVFPQDVTPRMSRRGHQVCKLSADYNSGLDGAAAADAAAADAAAAAAAADAATR